MPYDRGFSMNAHARDDIEEGYEAGMCSFSIWWAQRIAFLCRLYHVWTDIKGIDRLYKPHKDDKRPLFMRVADEFEKVCEHFRPNEEVGLIFPTMTEVHTLTRMKGVGHQTRLKSLTGSQDPKFYQMFLNVRCTSPDMSSKPLVVVSDSS
eukprot:651732-Amphidinium_carterae.2